MTDPTPTPETIYVESTTTDRNGFVVTKGERKPAPPPPAPVAEPDYSDYIYFC